MISKEGFDAYGIDNAQTGIELCEKMLNSWSCSATLKLDDMEFMVQKRGYLIFDELTAHPEKRKEMISSILHLAWTQSASPLANDAQNSLKEHRGRWGYF